MAHWEWIDTFALEFHERGRDGFLNDHPRPFLVFQPPNVDEIMPEQTSTLKISGRRMDLAKKLSPEKIQRLAKVEGLRVIAIQKSQSHRVGSDVTLGRGPDNDLVIPHPTISRFHAYFSFTDDGRVALTDAGSRNGTRINGSRLKVKWTASLMPGDKLIFGELEGTYQPAEDFCEFLSMLSDGW